MAVMPVLADGWSYCLWLVISPAVEQICTYVLDV